ncbi:hypothetical protein MIR68_010634 [Amoeboaphelidium protococcarum]|nr:hypothetical protein MIR68_010634 [Amoeboaphelidium protococcarum]
MMMQKISKQLESISRYRSLNAVLHSKSRSDVLSQIQHGLDDDSLPLKGMTFMAKDSFCTPEFPSGADSRFLSNYNPPSETESTVIKLLKANGAICTGKTSMDEFGMGSYGLNSVSPPVLNPHDQRRVAGGSSSGSAVVVSTEQCDFALGTDTGGSTRLPAAYCRVYGFKPSYGMLSRWGLITYASSLDTVGIFARDISTIDRAFNVMNVYDSQDPTSLTVESRLLLKQKCDLLCSRLNQQEVDTDNNASVIKVGIPIEYFPSEVDYEQFLHDVEELNLNLVPITLPHTKYALSTYYTIASSEAASNLARYDGIRFGERTHKLDMQYQAEIAETRSTYFGSQVQRRILLGNYVTSSAEHHDFYMNAMKVRRLIAHDYSEAFKKVDVLLTPVSIGDPPLIENVNGGNRTSSSLQTSSASVDEYLNDVFTTPASLAGRPSICVPLRQDSWKSAQLIADYGCDSFLLKYVDKLMNQQQKK